MSLRDEWVKEWKAGRLRAPSASTWTVVPIDRDGPRWKVLPILASGDPMTREALGKQIPNPFGDEE